MNFTFGIITGGGNRVPVVVKAIKDRVPDPEIIVVGGGDTGGVIHIPFNEDVRHMWITRKKNLITETATHDNIVYMHDYVVLCDGWYEGFLKFGDDWDICMNVITNLDGKRYRDWVTWGDPGVEGLKLVDYHTFKKPHQLYISGAYWVAKKYVMEDEPLDDRLGWGQGEDVEWSKRVRSKYRYVMNPHSEVSLLKQKEVIATL